MRTAELRRGLASSEGEVPGSLSVCSDNTLNRHAFWGKIQLLLEDGADPGFMRGERAVIMVPIRQFGRESEASWGLIRIAMYTESDAARLAALRDPAELAVFADGVPMVLQGASQPG
jgi:hypothetical protein